LAVNKLKASAAITFVTGKASRRGLGFGIPSALFDAHVLELAGLEDLAAFLTFDELGVFIAADDLHTGMLAGLLLLCAGRRRRRLCGHKSGRQSSRAMRGTNFTRISRYFRPPLLVVKWLMLKER
jgi:hypothetical protein